MRVRQDEKMKWSRTTQRTRQRYSLQRSSAAEEHVFTKVHFHNRVTVICQDTGDNTCTGDVVSQPTQGILRSPKSPLYSFQQTSMHNRTLALFILVNSHCSGSEPGAHIYFKLQFEPQPRHARYDYERPVSKKSGCSIRSLPTDFS